MLTGCCAVSEQPAVWVWNRHIQLRELQRDMGMSYLFITHNIGVVEYIADRVAVMRAGELLEHGPALQVLDHPTHDYTRTLLAAVPRVDGPLRARVAVG